jgi:hypothetical protein
MSEVEQGVSRIMKECTDGRVCIASFSVLLPWIFGCEFITVINNLKYIWQMNKFL